MVGPAQIQAAGIDMNQRTSYAMQWNFSVQREVAPDTVVEAGYLANMGLKLEQNVQPNNALPGTGSGGSSPPVCGVGIRARYCVSQLPDGVGQQCSGRIR